MSEPIAFKRVAISPFDCLSQSWERVRDQYWLFLGITVVGIMLGSAAPMGLLIGPMMCGVYSCYLDKWRGKTVRFDGVFKGFESPILVNSIVATLVTMVIMMVLAMPLVVVGVAGVILTALAGGSRHGSETAGLLTALVFVGLFLLWMLVMMVISLFFAFTYPLIVDRKMAAIDALKLSARAALANIWGLLGLTFTTTVLALGGMIVCCYFGAFLLMPITFGALMGAYVKVFGLSEAGSSAS